MQIQTELVRAPGQPNAVVRPPEEPTSFAYVPTCVGAPDELIELVGDQEEPTEVTKVIKAPNIKPQVAHAPDEEKLIAVARAPEELLDIKEALQQMKEVLAEARPNDLSLIENVSQDVRDFQDPQEAIQHIDFLMSAVTSYRTQHRSALAVFEQVSIQQIGDYESAIQALNQKPESVSRVFPNCDDAIHITNNFIQDLTLTQAPHIKSSSPGSEFGSELGDAAQDDFEEATSQPT